MRKFRFSTQAAVDVALAVDWYDAQSDGIGKEFDDALDEVCRSISRMPAMYSPVAKRCRKALMRRFPYAVYYHFDSEWVSVVAVLHAKGDPKKLKSRLH